MRKKHLSDEQISAFIDGEIISDGDRKHLDECTLCASKLKSYKMISNALINLKTFSPSPNINEKIRLKLSNEPYIDRYTTRWNTAIPRYSLALSIVFVLILISVSAYIINFMSLNLTETSNMKEPTEISASNTQFSTENTLNFSEEPPSNYSEDIVNLLLALDYESKSNKNLDIENLMNVSLSDVILSLGDDTELLEEY